jgi:hypothetical protein
VSHCTDCTEIATHKCLICLSSFCEACAKRHLAFYAYPNSDATIIKLKGPPDAETL